MKQKLAAAGLALTLLFGGATFSSATVQSVPVLEKQVNLKQEFKDDEMQPMLWAVVGKAVGKGVAMGVGWVVGESAARKVLGNSESPLADYEYEEVIVSFDQ